MANRPIWSSQKNQFPKFLVILLVIGLSLLGMSRLEFFREYLGALLPHWIALMSGVVSVAITFWEKIHDSIGKYVLYTVAAMCVFLAGFQAWEDQHRATIEAQNKLEGLTTPKLTADFGEALGTSEANPADSVITLSGLIKNQGAPTVLDNWSLDAELPDRTIHGHLLFVPTPKQNIEMQNRKGQIMFYLSGAEHWVRITRDSPIVPGGGKQGWINALLPSVTNEELRAKKATIVLSCRDVNGKQWFFRDTLGEGKEASEPFLKLEDVMKQNTHK